ncbi:MAG: hypothetical protein ABIO70_33805 [Pseudomonadota bacterium]
MEIVYAVDKNTLALSQVLELPVQVRSLPRMMEECIESVVAANLSILFPDEDILLVNAQDSLLRDADILAIDPIGCVRVFELKRVPVRKTDISNQAFSYGLAVAGMPSDYWITKLANRLPCWPEEQRLARLGVALNVRTKNLGPKYASLNGYHGNWAKLTRFSRAEILAGLLESHLPSPNALTSSGLLEIIKRTCAGVDIFGTDLSQPLVAAERVLRSWGSMPSARSLEVLVVGPSADSRAVISGLHDIDSRNVDYALIDAELRPCHDASSNIAGYLTWRVVRRSISNDVRIAAVALQKALHAGGSHRELRLVRFTLRGRNVPRMVSGHGPFHAMLSFVDEGGQLRLETETDSLTEGLSLAGSEYHSALIRLKERFVDIDPQWRTSGRRLSVPLTPFTTTFVEAYFAECERVGLLSATAWSRRPAGI